MSTIEIEDRLGITFCDRQQIAIERGEGSWVWDENGKAYLDFTSGWGVTCLGHSHPVITEAIYKQASKIIQNPNSGFTYSPSRAALLEQIDKVLPENLYKIFFANSGAEANDAAIKLARKATGRTKVVSTLGSFHGRTFNTLSVSGGTEDTKKYIPTLPGSCFVPFGDCAAIERAVDKNTAAVILEPIQGEGGVRVPDSDYLSFVSRLCKRNGALLIIDEIQTGFCRTGKFFAIEHDAGAIEPDILTMGKGIAGGFPFAAFAISNSVDARIAKGDHGGTYCGNPLGCAVATAVIEHLASKKIERRVELLGEMLLGRLGSFKKEFPTLISDIRGRGLLAALEFSDPSMVEEVSRACLQSGLLVTPTKNGVIRVIPALTISEEELNEGLDILKQVLGSVAPRE